MNLNCELSEIVHLATQAILSDDENVKRVALGDIYHAIASILPVDHAARSAAPRTPPDRKAVQKAIAYADGYVCSVERMGRKLVGVVEHDDGEWHGLVYDGEHVILDVSSNIKGKCFVIASLRGAMRDVSTYLTHRKRSKQNRKERRAAAALTPSAELAATVARQQGDEDLAQRLENA